MAGISSREDIPDVGRNDILFNLLAWMTHRKRIV
jgi:hypothetical protein